MSDPNSSITYKSVPGYPGYRVGDDGSVWSRRLNSGRLSDRWRLLLPSTGTRGYLAVKFCVDRRETTWRVSRLVLTVFVGPPSSGQEACHRNDDILDNRLSNLRWDSHQANVAERDAKGRQAKGEGQATAKLTDREIPKIRRLLAAGFSRRWVGKWFGVSRQRIDMIAAGRSWKHILNDDNCDPRNQSADCAETR